MNIPTRKTGFTLVEMLVTLAIIGVLVGTLLPAVQSAREAARRVACTNNVKQLGLALQAYHSVHGHFPEGSYAGKKRFWNLTGANWRLTIFPFLELASIYNSLDFNAENSPFSGCGWYGIPPWQAPNNILRNLKVSQMTCPSNPRSAFGEYPAALAFRENTFHADYCGIGGAYPDPGGRGSNACRRSFNGYTCNTGMLVPFETRSIKDAVDGTSKTLLIAEQSGQVGTDEYRYARNSNYPGAWAGGSDDGHIPGVIDASGSEQRPRKANEIPDDGTQNYYHSGVTIIRYRINFPAIPPMLSQALQQRQIVIQ